VKDQTAEKEIENMKIRLISLVKIVNHTYRLNAS